MGVRESFRGRQGLRGRGVQSHENHQEALKP